MILKIWLFLFGFLAGAIIMHSATPPVPAPVVHLESQPPIVNDCNDYDSVRHI